MRKFNPEKELKKIQKGNKNKIIIFVFLLLIVGVMGYSFALYQVRYSKRIIYTKVAPFNNKDLDLAVYVNGKPDKLPEKNTGYKYLDLVCENGNVISQWNEEKWELEFLSTVPIPNKCNAYFIDIENGDEKSFEYTGDMQEYIAPKDGLYKIELWGASGGPAYYGGVYGKQGTGGYTSGIINLEAGTNLYFYIGEKGATGTVGRGLKNKASFNGGGAGIGDSGDVNDAGGAGGGATDVRLIKGTSWNDFNSLKSRIMVAGGGGGGAVSNANVSSGSGGGITGVGDAVSLTLNNGTKFNATQITGYKFGIGQDGFANSGGGAGAGGGYFGGYADNISQITYGGAGGGSSYISGHPGCLAIDNSSLENNLTLKNGCTTDSNSLECSIHYSNYQFKHTVMIDGLGYQWTDKQGSYVGMPTFDGSSTMQGNTSNGYAKITYLSPA